jgi:hypothetical protein
MQVYTGVAVMQVVQSRASQQGTDGPGAMRCLDRSPGCTPVVGGSPTARVRMHSRPGHDNFAPLKSSTASPGGTPHARGQGRLPHVRVSHVDAAGHLEFNPMRCETASPGCTPLPSPPHSDMSEFEIPAAGVESDREVLLEGSMSNQPAGVPMLDLAGEGRASLPNSQGTDRTDQMHMVVVGHGSGVPEVISHRIASCRDTTNGRSVSVPNGRSVSIVSERNNEEFIPLHAGDRSPGHTPATPGLLATGGHSASHVRFISSGHDTFNPLTSTDSPGHTPHACAYSIGCAAAPAQACIPDAADPYVSRLPQPHTTIREGQAPHADEGHSLTSATTHCPGHIAPVPVSVSHGGSVTLLGATGHDNFHPIRSDTHSAGNTPRYRPSNRSEADAGILKLFSSVLCSALSVHCQ